MTPLLAELHLDKIVQCSTMPSSKLEGVLSALGTDNQHLSDYHHQESEQLRALKSQSGPQAAWLPLHADQAHFSQIPEVHLAPVGQGASARISGCPSHLHSALVIPKVLCVSLRSLVTLSFICDAIPSPILATAYMHLELLNLQSFAFTWS
jgi:hypothetical protein